MVLIVVIILQDILLTRVRVVCIENKVALCGRNSVFMFNKLATWVTICHVVWDDRCLIRVRHSIRHYLLWCCHGTEIRRKSWQQKVVSEGEARLHEKHVGYDKTAETTSAVSHLQKWRPASRRYRRMRRVFKKTGRTQLSAEPGSPCYSRTSLTSKKLRLTTPNLMLNLSSWRRWKTTTRSRWCKSFKH